MLRNHALLHLALLHLLLVFLRVLLKQLGESELLLALIILSLRTVRVFISGHLFVVVRTTTITTALSFPSRTVPIHFHLRFDLFERIFIVREEQFQRRIIFRLALFFVSFYSCFFLPLLLPNRRRVVLAVANRARRRRRLLHVLSFLVNVNLLLLLFVRFSYRRRIFLPPRIEQQILLQIGTLAQTVRKFV